MRTVDPALQAKLDGGATTLCRCWLITRSDGVRQGFTDHDENVVVDDVTCLADSGLDGSEVTQKFGLAVGGSDVTGALASDTINEDDLAAGRYDAAAVEIWLVDWSEPSLKLLLAAGTLGEVVREGPAFRAEVRGLAAQLEQESGRIYGTTCSADLGDARCGIDLGDPAYKGDGEIAAVTGATSFSASGLDAFASGWFTAGKVTFTSGANDGLSMDVKAHVSGEAVSLSLWQPMPQPLAAGDTFTVTAGCDKRFATCHDHFANAINFRGFPHIPGNDFVISYPVAGEPGHDGSSLNG